MAQKVLILNGTTGRVTQSIVQFVETTDAVTNLRGVAVANIAPTAGYALIYNSVLDQWQPGILPSGGGGGGGSITVRDIDLSPSITSVSTIEFTNGAVADMGAGVARVTISGSGAYRANQVPSPSPNGAVVAFALPSEAVNGSVMVFERLTAETSYRLVGPDRVSSTSESVDVSPLRVLTTNSANLVDGYQSSGTSAAWFDDSLSTGTGFSSYGADIDAPCWVAVDFGVSTPRAIVTGTIVGQTNGGWSPPRNHRWEYSDNGSTWTTAATAVGPSAEGQKTTHSWASVGARRYWRLYILDNHINSGGYSTCMREIELKTAAPAGINSVLFTVAPAATTLILCSYQASS